MQHGGLRGCGCAGGLAWVRTSRVKSSSLASPVLEACPLLVDGKSLHVPPTRHTTKPVLHPACTYPPRVQAPSQPNFGWGSHCLTGSGPTPFSLPPSCCFTLGIFHACGGHALSSHLCSLEIYLVDAIAMPRNPRLLLHVLLLSSTSQAQSHAVIAHYPIAVPGSLAQFN